MAAHAKPIFVIGCTRSGKSLVAAILNKHPDLFITFESQIYTGLFREWTYALRKHGADPRDTFRNLFLENLSLGWVQAI